MKGYFSQTSRINSLQNENEIKRDALLTDLEKTKRALEVAYCGFDNVTEPDLIDCYIYEVNAVLKRYKFLLEEVSRLQPASEEMKTENLCTESPVGVLT